MDLSSPASGPGPAGMLHVFASIGGRNTSAIPPHEDNKRGNTPELLICS
jgi:hypothetical protein